MLVCYAREQPTLSAFCGVICGTEILRATNFAVSIHWTATSWISIVRPQSSRSNWMAAGITIAPDKFATERGQNFWLAKGSLRCGFGIIKFARNSTASCKRSGPHWRSAARRKRHLNPLPCQRKRRALERDGFKPVESFSVSNGRASRRAVHRH